MLRLNVVRSKASQSANSPIVKRRGTAMADNTLNCVAIRPLGASAASKARVTARAALRTEKQAQFSKRSGFAGMRRMTWLKIL